MTKIKKSICMLISAVMLFAGVVPIMAAENGVGITIGSEKVGNIFFGDEEAKFDVVFKNTSGTDKDITATYSVYKYDNTMKAVLSSTNNRKIHINAGEKFTDTIAPEAKEYALYKLEVKVGTEITCADFSRAVRSNNTNPTLGVSAHLTTVGDIHNSLMLVNAAGISNLRDDFRWNEIEKTKGDVKLTSRMKTLILNAESYGIDILPVIYGWNSLYQNDTNSFVTDADAIKSYGVYLKKLMQTDEFKNYINNVEILNEPDCAKIPGYEATDGTAASNKARGAAYATILKEAYTAIKDVKPSVTVGAFSTCSVNTEGTKQFVQAVLDNLDAKYFDAVTEHPYFGSGYTDEQHKTYRYGTLIKSLGDYHGLFTGKFANSTRWHTEYGSTTADDGGKGFSVANQYEQAVKAIRAYNTIKRYSFSDKLYLYCLANNGSNETATADNYGMLRAHNYETPYAAKATYLAVANMNNILGNATECITVSDGTDSSFITKYTADDREVYMMYCEKGKTMKKAYTLPSGVTFYDLYGNKLDNVYTGGKCSLTEAPIYAVIGEALTSAKEIENFKITGSVPSGAEGKMVTLSVTEGDIEFDEVSAENMIYIDQQFTEQYGRFEFDIVLDTSKNYTAYVVSSDDTTPVCLKLSAESAKNIELELYTGISKIKNVSVSTDELSKAYAKVTYNDTGVKGGKLYLAIYNGKKLVGTKIADSAAGEEKVDLSGIAVTSYDNIKLMLWDKTNGMIPLCDVLDIK